MNGNHSSDRQMEQFMRAVDNSTPYEEARVPSSRLIWLKARWAEKREREERVARIRLLIEGGVQAVVGFLALLTVLFYWPDIEASLIGLLSAAGGAAGLTSAVLVTGAVLALVVSLVGTRAMVRG